LINIYFDKYIFISIHGAMIERIKKEMWI